MAAGIDLAGVIGTWVAVGLALIALFGVVTPILLIRRARSERQVALRLIDDENNEFVHPGIKIPFLPGIARTINAPNLQARPELTGQVLGRDDDFLNQKHSVTGWIMFARTLKAYNIALHPTGSLRIHRSQSWLPVHHLWIFTVGLLGRYGHRPDRGRLLNAPAPGRIDQRDLEPIDRNALYGITGVLRYRASEFSSDAEQGFGQIYFSSHDKDTRGSLQPDSVPLAVLFWLCMGCVPLFDGRVFDVSRQPRKVQYRSRPQREQQRNSSQTTGSSNGARPMLPTYRFQLIENSTPSSRVLSWAQILLGQLPQLWWMCEYTLTPTERVEVERISGAPDDPEGISSPWINTESLAVDEYFDDPSLLWRTDVQCLALGILKMEWSPRGCLFDARRGLFCRRLLCSASASLRALLQASYRICEASTSPTPARTNLTGSIKRLLPMCSSRITAIFSRALHEALYDFEQALTSDDTPGLHSMAIGVIFITSETFRNFVLGTVMEQDSHANILTLDPNSKSFTIIAPGTFFDKKFVLDFDAVFNETLLPATVSFTREKVLFAALQACVRSVVFRLSFDSADLLDFVGHMEDVVYVSAVSNVPLSQRNRAESNQPSTRGQSPPESTQPTEYTNRSIHSGPENDENEHHGRPRAEMSTPERERNSIELQLDHLESRISDLAPADNVLQERVDRLRATSN